MDIATESSIKHLSGTLGWGLTGGVIFGPVGLLAGLLLGGKSTEVTFVVSFDDGRAFIATSEKNAWVAIKGATIKSHARQSAKLSARKAQELLAKPSGPPPGATIHELIEWTFRDKGWQVRKLAKPQYQRFDLSSCLENERTMLVAHTPDELTDYSLGLIDSTFQREMFDTRAILVKDIGESVRRSAAKAGIVLAAPTTSGISRIME